MALGYEAFLIGGTIFLAIGAATYLISKRSQLGAAAFFAATMLVLVALNYV